MFFIDFCDFYIYSMLIFEYLKDALYFEHKTTLLYKRTYYLFTNDFLNGFSTQIFQFIGCLI